ncbi:MAG TPA: prefoldin subunit beta [Archaeoglobaceae archaeon]|nr:prefoldin subunit beta [Archaeoglobaceae archaeon]
MNELPPQVQNMLAQLQQLQQQLQSVVSQKLQVEALKKETEDSLNEVQNVSEDVPLYKATGSILVKVEKGNLLEELEEKKATYEVRLNALKRQEEKLRERLKDMQEKIQSMLSPQAG